MHIESDDSQHSDASGNADQRLDAMERKLRTQRGITTTLVFVVVALAVAVASLALIRGRTGRVVQAERYEVLNSDGNVCGSLGIDAHGRASLTANQVFVTSPGLLVTTVVSLSGSFIGGRISIKHRGGKDVVVLSADKTGGGMLTLNNQTGANLVAAGTSQGGNGGLWIKSKDAKETDVVMLGVDDAGSGRLSLKAKSGTNIFSAGADKEGNGDLTLSTKSGNGLVNAGANKGGSGGLWIKSKAGNAVVLGSDNENGVVLIMSKSGTEIVSLGASTEGNGGVWIKNKDGKVAQALVGEDRQGNALGSWHYQDGYADSPKAPIRLVRTGHKLIRRYGSGQALVEWGWMVEVQNKTETHVELQLQFDLKDADGFSVAEDGLSLGGWGKLVNLAPQETRVVRYTSNASFDRVSRAVSHGIRWKHQVRTVK